MFPELYVRGADISSPHDYDYEEYYILGSDPV
jgi:hypothetical protein